MNTISYKGYIGEYQQYTDGPDSSSYFAGEIPSVNRYAKVIFEGETMEELTEDFHAAVDDCIRLGYLPVAKSHRVSIPDVLYAQLSMKARQSGISVSNYVSKTLASIVL